VEFEDDDAAAKSITLLNGKQLKGRPLRVNEAENRPPRPPGSAPGGPRPPFGSPRPGGFGDRRPDFAAAPPMGDDFGGGFGDRGGRGFKNKGSRRNIRRRKRGFD
jgi:RNA recognition motif-containing protein